MNKIIFLVTLSALLTLSIFAKAEIQPRIVSVPMTNMNYDNESMTLELMGYLPTQCVVSPQPKLSATKLSNVLMVTVVGSDFSENCTMAIGGAYQLAFDIRSLKYNIVELNLDPEATYKLITQDGSEIATVAFGETPLVRPYATHHAVGAVLAVENDGRATIVLPSNEVLHLNSPFINVAPFVGQHVEVQGHMVKYHTPGTSLKPMATTPQTIIVTGINTTAL
ncbi:MAG: hypothetical protein KDD38_07920 [Bdellovibrionales bacterium]|nr:hypothetical protein [Bdellovibrionales bacterium]